MKTGFIRLFVPRKVQEIDSFAANIRQLLFKKFHLCPSFWDAFTHGININDSCLALVVNLGHLGGPGTTLIQRYTFDECDQNSRVLTNRPFDYKAPVQWKLIPALLAKPVKVELGHCKWPTQYSNTQFNRW